MQAGRVSNRGPFVSSTSHYSEDQTRKATLLFSKTDQNRAGRRNASLAKKKLGSLQAATKLTHFGGRCYNVAMNDSERIESPCAAGKPNSPASGPLVRGERLCVVMPVYNERDAIGGVLRKWSAMLDELGLDYVIRPYNDGSKDDSLAVMRAAAASLPHAEVHDKPNGGHGPTILRGYLEAADGFDWVFQVDSDDEMGPEHFAELWKRRGDFDFLVGRRAGRSQALVRKTISFVSRVVVRLFFGRSRVWDVNSPYRLMRVSALAPVFCSIPETTFAPNIIITGMSARLGLRTLELPVPQHDRTTGEVSIRKWRLFRAAVRSLCQTVVYSFASSSPSPPGLNALIAAVPALVALCSIDLTSVIWYDELCMGDGVFMKALHGLDWSGVWACSYNPLYPFCLTGWVKLLGVSHFALCSFTIVVGYLANLVLLGICHRRRFFSGFRADLALILMFWGGWHFAWILSIARVDILVLLLSMLFLDALAGYEGRPTTRASAAWAFFLFLAAPYMLPMLFAAGVALLIGMRRMRRELVRRGFAAALGFGAAFVVVLAYYAARQDLFRFLGSYVYFNSITGYCPQPFVERLSRAYLYDGMALVLGLVSLVLAVWKRQLVPVAGFVFCIPLLMLMGGRYECYYAGAFYVPVLVLSVTLFARHVPRALAVLIALGAVTIVARPVVNYQGTLPERQRHAACRRFVERQADRFRPGDDVVVAADLDGCTGFYYPLVERNVHVWYRGAEMLNGRTDEEKFSEGLSYVTRSEEARTKLRACISRVQRFMPLLPERGYVLFYSAADCDALKPLYERHGKALSELATDGTFSLYSLEPRKIAGP